MSAPCAPGGSIRPSDTTSVKTAISSAPCCVRLLGDRREVDELAVEGRRLHDDAGGLVVDRGEDVFRAARVGRRARRSRPPAMRGQRLHRLAVVRVQAAGEHRLPPPRHAVRHQHRLGGGGRAVVHGGVGDLHAGEVRDLRLELEEILQRALRDLRLVGRVGGQELRALDDVVDRRRHMMAVGAGADEERPVAGRMVLRGEAAQDARSLPARSCASAGRAASSAASPAGCRRRARRSSAPTPIRRGLLEERYPSMRVGPVLASRACAACRRGLIGAGRLLRLALPRQAEPVSRTRLDHDLGLHRIGDEAELVRLVVQRRRASPRPAPRPRRRSSGAASPGDRHPAAARSAPSRPIASSS